MVPKGLRFGIYALLSLVLSQPALGIEATPSPPAAVAPARDSGPLPADIFIKTKTRTFNSRFYYALRDGKIWIRPNRQVTGQDEPWTLMPCEGLPCNPEIKDFPPPKSIAEISADGDELTVLDEQGRFYIRTMAGPGWFSKTEWTHLNGFPKDELTMPARLAKRRAWGMGRRHFDVLWHEDADGNEHHVGTMGTSSIYVLGDRGDEIWFTDNGLPADFSHAGCGPERGSFVAENLQASAGTLFVIDARGRMYTSLDDFDLNGGTSMFISYTYTPQKKYDKPKGSEYNSHLKPWRLPITYWREQPAIPLRGQARLSKAITILQNGQGNAARELRVAGTDAGGRSGYYHKPIFAESWDFQPAALEPEAMDWLAPDKAPAPLPPQDVTYMGALTLGPNETYVAELNDFNLHCSPATLRLFLPDGPVDMKLHTVDAWISVKREDPGRDGTVQLMLGTLEAPADKLESLPKTLKGLHQNVFRLHVGATTDHVFLYHLDGRLQGVLPRTKALPPSVRTKSYRYGLPAGPFAAARLREAGYEMTRVLDPDLLRLDLDTIGADQLETLTWENHLLLQDLQKEADLIQSAKQAAWLQAMGTTALRGVYAAGGLCWWMPNGQAFCRTAPSLLGAYYRLEDDLDKEALLRYRGMIMTVSMRLQRYRDRMLELKGPDWKLQPPPGWEAKALGSRD